VNSPPEHADAPALLQSLVEYLKREGHLRAPRVEAAFRAVPRHLFLPGLPLERVYSDEAIATKVAEGRPVSSSSQPAIMAIMLEQLDLQPGHRVLEIGAGTGYNAALLAHIVGEAGLVVTLDIDRDVVDNARAHLRAAGYERVRVVHADGGFGYPAAAPFDRIILTVGSGEITPAWREQLTPDGRLVLPLSLKQAQKSVAFEKRDGYLVSVSLRDCGFMRLRGAFAEPEHLIPLGPESGLCLSMGHPSRVDAESVYRLLGGPAHEAPTGVSASPREIWAGLTPWLELREPDLVGLSADGETITRGLVPCLLEGGGPSSWCYTCGLLGEASLSVLARRPAPGPALASSRDEQPFELIVRRCGAAEGEALARRLIEHVTAWDAAGRPSTQGMRIRAYPAEADYAPAPDEIVIPKRWTRLVLDWPGQ
jgi:protein-L-isoaspartate(D-aspartate) O-methyltransferase